LAEDCRLVAGIDEAGRGPLLGPMVVTGVSLPERRLPELLHAGVRDSKDLTPQARRLLAELIEKLSSHVVVVLVPPRLIDSVNLNELEENTIIFIIERLYSVARAGGCSLRRVYVDAVGPPERLEKRLREATGLEVVVSPKADARYLPVSAASIIAKVARDAEVEKLRRLYGVRGSGYPTDPETLAWLREAYQRSPDRPPDYIRASWGTLRRVAPGWYRPKRRRGQRSLLDFLGPR